MRLKAGPRRPIDEVMDGGPRARSMQQVPGLNVDMAQLMEDLIGDLTAVPQPIEVKLFTDDPKTLLATARKVAGEIGKIPGVVDVRNGINPAGDALDVEFDYVKAALEGVDPAEATRLLNNYLYGQVATEIPTQVKQIGVRVWSPPDARATERDLGNFMVRAPDGHLFPLRRIARLVPVTGEPEIGRENLQADGRGDRANQRGAIWDRSRPMSSQSWPSLAFCPIRCDSSSGALTRSSRSPFAALLRCSARRSPPSSCSSSSFTRASPSLSQFF